MAWMLPVSTEIDTSSSARTPGKVFEMCFISMMGWLKSERLRGETGHATIAAVAWPDGCYLRSAVV
jgi:hypothetical protein